MLHITLLRSNVSHGTVVFIGLFAISLFVSMVGCSSNEPHGLYVASDGEALYFDGSGASSYMGVTAQPSGNFTGTCLFTGGQFSVDGDTLRIEGGELTEYGQVLELFVPPSAGNVTLLQITDNGQALNYTEQNGSALTFIRQ